MPCSSATREKKRWGDLQQDAHAVAGLALGILTGAVFQMLYDLQRIINGFVAFAPLNIYDRTNAAVIMLKARVIQPAGALRSVKFSISFIRSFPVAFFASAHTGYAAKTG